MLSFVQLQILHSRFQYLDIPPVLDYDERHLLNILHIRTQFQTTKSQGQPVMQYL